MASERDISRVSLTPFMSNPSALPRLYNRLIHLLVGSVQRTHGQVIVGDYYPPTASPGNKQPEAEHLERKFDGKHNTVTEYKEHYSPYSSPSKLTLESLRRSATFKQALTRIDSSQP